VSPLDLLVLERALARGAQTLCRPRIDPRGLIKELPDPVAKLIFVHDRSRNFAAPPLDER
jgi:hypothetical protein